MKRRKFISNSALTGAAAITGAKLNAEKLKQNLPSDAHTFNLKYAPHFGMFKHSAGDDLLDQLQFMSDAGFTAMEDNGMTNRTVEMQDKIGNKMAALGMEMGVFVVFFGEGLHWKKSMATGNPEFKQLFIKACHNAVEVAKRVNAKWMTVVPGFFDRSLAMGYQTSHVIDFLRAGAEIFEPHGLVMVLEPLSDTPELFLRHSDQTYMICKAVNSPSCKILYDIYHMQRNEGQLIKNIDACWDEVGYIQIGDNPGRNEPTSGEINYKNVFSHIHGKGFDGILGMEHGNAFDGAEGELKLINAYKEVDNFLG